MTEQTPTNSDPRAADDVRRRRIAVLTFTALGVVYGDIGTSPLYAVRECFVGEQQVPPTDANVLGVLSLILWSLLLVISLKYLTFVMRADNDGEGGILALMMLALPRKKKHNGRTRWLLTVMGLFGAGLLYGDGMITPAISVLSAIEGIKVVEPTSAFDHLIVPITLVILLGLFWFQHKGTARVGGLFGPVMLVWFSVIAALGIFSIVRHPAVLQAVSPHYALEFFLINRFHGFIIMGVVFLVVTGGEALYADMGHFGRLPIRIAWFALVLPALLVNYFGQGALLLSHQGEVSNPFYQLVPDWGLIPLMVLATAATVIASQAVISGAFSLSMQAVQLGYLPRMESVHTSKDERGQVYIPAVNWLLFAAVVGLVLAFESSTRLASAYGMAITTTMVVTTVLFYLVARHRWRWPLPVVAALTAMFLVVDLAFFGANLVKILDGGWLPLLVGAAVCLVMLTWQRGRAVVAEDLRKQLISADALLVQVADEQPVRIDEPAVFLGTDPDGVPLALLHNLRHNRVLHRPLGLLTIVFEDEPWVPLDGRLEFKSLGQGVYRIIAHYGFKQRANVSNVLDQCRQYDVDFTGPKTTFFVSRVTLDVASRRTMSHWRKLLFIWLSRNASDVSAFFNIPPEQVVEIGVRQEV